MNRVLILTPKKECWNLNSPVIFLGDWYIGNWNPEISNKIDFIVHENIDFNKSILNVDQELFFYYKELITDLVEVLNKIHGENNEKRYWEIIIGPWLKDFISCSYHRYNNILSVLNSYNIDSAILAKGTTEYALVTDNTSNFLWNASNNVEWNFIFESKIVEFLRPDIKKSICEIELNQIRPLAKKKLSSTFKNFLVNLTGKLFARSNHYFFYQSYFPFILNLKLSLKYRQIPQIWTDYSLPFFEVDKNKRKAIDFPKKRLDHFLDFLRNMIPETLPTIFFEGYSSLVECSQKTSWPLDPKIIFTSNAFYFDEVFKTWVARKSSLGVLYYIGQHGNNYGTKIGNANSIELLTCDKFFTWGWQYNHKKHIKGFNFKISHKQNQLNIPSTGILLIELHPLHRIGPFDDHGIFKKYLSNQFSFVNHLPENIRSKLTVRLHSASKYFQWKEDVLWKARFKDIKIDTGGKDIFKLMFNSKLVVHSYDSTGILETLCLNIPTLCFWDKEFDHIEENAKPFYIMLKDSNIYFNSPESLASHISEIWDNLDSWWYSEKVQNARLSFVDQFSRKSNNCADDIYNLINLTIK